MQFSRTTEGKHYGLASIRERHDDRGSPSSNTKWSREPEGAFQTARDQSEDPVAKWKRRTSLADLPTGRKSHTRQLCLWNRKQSLSLSAGTRCFLLMIASTCSSRRSPSDTLVAALILQRYDISRLPDVEGDKELKKKFKSYLIGYFHVDIAEVHTAQGRLYLFVAIDRTFKFSFVQLDYGVDS